MTNKIKSIPAKGTGFKVPPRALPPGRLANPAKTQAEGAVQRRPGKNVPAPKLPGPVMPTPHGNNERKKR